MVLKLKLSCPSLKVMFVFNCGVSSIWLNFDKVISLQSDQSTRDDWLLRVEYHIDCNKKQCVTKWKDRNYCNLLVYNLTKKYQRAWFPRCAAVHPKGLLSRKHTRNRRRQFAYGHPCITRWKLGRFYVLASHEALFSLPEICKKINVLADTEYKRRQRDLSLQHGRSLIMYHLRRNDLGE